MKPKLKLFSLLLLAGCVSVVAHENENEKEQPSNSNTYTITLDEGGETELYHNRALLLAKAKKAIIIDGRCASACTILLMQAKYNLDICATPKAILFFHMPYFISSTTNELIMNAENEKESKLLWHTEWLGHFSPKLNFVLERATKAGHIPNPSATGDPDGMYSFQATHVFKEC